jgi:hypothetical protein
MAKLPTVVSSLPQDLKAFINQVREALDGRNGDRLLTVDDLVRSGVASSGPNGTITPPPGVVATPITPKNVQASGAIQNIIVTWDDPLYNGHSHAEVWGSSTNSLGAAVRVGMTPGAIFVDAVGPSVNRYYWVRFVNVLGVVGAFNAVAGVLGQTGSDVAYLLDTLTTAALDPNSDYSKFAVRADFFFVMPSPDFNQEATPTATATGDIWYQPSTEITRTWTGSTWGPFSQTLPFVVNTSTQTINGVSVPAGVYMDAAFIKNGTITTAKIGDAQIDNAKIVSLTASKITAGDISVGNYIQSSGFISGSQGWRIHGNGVAEFAAASIRGQLVAAQINANGLSIKDTAGNIILNAGTGDFTGSVAGTAGSTLVNTANTALSTADFAVGELTTKLDNDARNVLSGPGGLATGTLNWNSAGVRTSGSGVGLTANGLVAYNSAGAATFVLNGSNGDASFAGTLSAATGSFAGSLSAATGTFSGTLTASAINAVNTINIAGEAVTIPRFIYAPSAYDTSLDITVTEAAKRIFILASVIVPNGGYVQSLSIDGAIVRTESLIQGSVPALMFSTELSVGLHTIRVWNTDTTALRASIYALVTLR